MGLDDVLKDRNIISRLHSLFPMERTTSLGKLSVHFIAQLAVARHP